jgi:hypothetical protein
MAVGVIGFRAFRTLGAAEAHEFAFFLGCPSPKLHPAEELNRIPNILTVKSRLDYPTRANWETLKIKADGILARDSSSPFGFRSIWLATLGGAHPASEFWPSFTFCSGPKLIS